MPDSEPPRAPAPRRRRWSLLLLALLVVLGAVPGCGADQGEDAGRIDWAVRCARNTNGALDRADVVTGRGRDVLVIGDSWSAGLGLADPGESWPTRLPGRVSVDAYSGSGFTRGASPCGQRSFAVRAARVVPERAPLVVVQGGLNDVDQPSPQLVLGFMQLVRALHHREVRRVLVVGPALAPERGPSVVRVDRQLAALCAATGVEYVSTTGWDVSYQRDQLHPDLAGHRAFGDAVAAAIRTG